MTAASSASREDLRRRRGPAAWVVSIVFAFAYAFFAFQGLSNLIGVTQQFTATYSALDVQMPASALLTLIGLVAVPVVVYVAIVVVARRAPAWKLALIFFVGLTVVAVITLDLQSLYRAIPIV